MLCSSTQLTWFTRWLTKVGILVPTILFEQTTTSVRQSATLQGILSKLLTYWGWDKMVAISSQMALLILLSTNPLWSREAIWRHRFGSTMVCGVKCILTNTDLSSLRFRDIHLTALALDDLKMPINKTRVRIVFLNCLCKSESSSPRN